MSAEYIFSIANITNLAGWLVLITMGRRRWVHEVLTGRILPLLLSSLYAVVFVTHWGEAKGGFSSLAGVQALFANEWLLLAGWIHYLAFDLFVGSWEMRDAQQHRIPQWAMIPCLILTSLVGPLGLLSYTLVRTLALRKLSGAELQSKT
jgi:Domain of unknown function (DUF4281)